MENKNYDQQNAPQQNPENQPQANQPQYQQNMNYPGGQYYMPPQKVKKPIYKKWWFWVIIVIVVIIVLSSLFGGDPDSSTTETETNTVTQSQSESETETPSLIEAGTSVTVDGLEISYISCDPDYRDYDEYFGPQDGNKVIRAEFEFKNVSDTDCSLSNFDCYADGAKCTDFYYADDYASPTLETISPNRTFKAVVYYEVPENAQNIEMEMETNFWTDDKVIFSVK